MIGVELFSATLKRCFPLLKQRAPTGPLKGTAFRLSVSTAKRLRLLAAEGDTLSWKENFLRG
jgi:hypothetical protein